jgi:hypothetical protein
VTLQKVQVVVVTQQEAVVEQEREKGREQEAGTIGYLVRE